MRKDLPDESQFYRFLKTAKNSLLQQIYYRINKKLIEQDIISLDTFIMDSKPVLAATKDNNLKNPNRNTTNKDNKSKWNTALKVAVVFLFEDKILYWLSSFQNQFSKNC